MAAVPRTEREQLALDPSEEERAAAAEAEQLAAQEQAEAQQQEQALADVPEWVPEKFRKDPTKFAESYTNLERELRERGTREREYAERIAQLEAAQTEQQPQAQTDDPLAAYATELEAAREAGDTYREAQLQAWLNDYTTRRAMQQQDQQRQQQQGPLQEQQDFLTAAYVKRAVSEKIPDWADYEQRVGDLLNEEPWRLSDEVMGSPDRVQRAVTAAYESVKYQDLIEQQRLLEEQGVTAADVSRARKLSSQTLSGSTGRPGEPSEADKQIAEMRQALHGTSWEHMPHTPAA